VPTTEYDPTTLKRVPNHDAARRQKELDAVLANLNQGNAQVGQPGDAPGATEAQPVGTGSSPDPTNFSAPTVIELPAASTPPPPAPVVEPSPTVTAEEYAKLQKQYREACQALTPAMQRSAVLAQDLKTERETTKSQLDSLTTQIAELKELFKKPQASAYEPELDTELETLDPVVADRFRRLSMTTKQQMEAMERKHQAELQELRDQERQRQEALLQHQNTTRQQTWDDVFTKLVPDYMDYADGGAKGPALVAWTQQMPAEYSAAIVNPRGHTPFFVAKVVNEFKASQMPVGTSSRQPAPGDLAAQISGSAPTRVETRTQEPPLTTDEIRNAQSIMDKLMREATNTKNSKEIRDLKMAEAKNFMTRFERLKPNQ
jgi:hypothetical protein